MDESKGSAGGEVSKVAVIITATLSIVIGSLLIAGIADLFTPREVTVSQEQLKQLTDDVKVIKNKVELLDYDKKDLFPKVIVVKDLPGHVVEGEAPIITEKTITVDGRISSGYLYVKASVENKKLLRFDSVYAKLASQYQNQHVEIGGHLRRDKSLRVPDTKNYTEFLYQLNEVFYIPNVPYNEGPEVRSGDFLSILNEGDGTKVFTFLSTLRNGIISELSIHYECEMGSECSITVRD